MRSSALRSRPAPPAHQGGGELAAPCRSAGEGGDLREAARALVESCESVLGAAADCIARCAAHGTRFDRMEAAEGPVDGAALAGAAAAFAELAAIALVRSNAVVALARQRTGMVPAPLAQNVDRLRAVAPFPRASAPFAVPSVERLTAREREVLGLLVRGNTNRQLAAVLGLSTRTVESHRANLMAKLGLASRVELVGYAAARGLL